MVYNISYMVQGIQYTQYMVYKHKDPTTYDFWYPASVGAWNHNVRSFCLHGLLSLCLCGLVGRNPPCLGP